MAEAAEGNALTSGGSPGKYLAVVLAIAALYQVFIFFAYPMAPGPDAWTYLTYPEQLFSGDYYSPVMVRQRSPAYPLFLAAVMGIFGENGLALTIAHHFLALIFVTLFFLSLRRFGLLFACIVSSLVAVAPQVADHFHFCSTEPLYLVLLAATLLSIDRYLEQRSGWWAFAAGACLPLTASCRPVFTLLSYALLLLLLLKRSRWPVRGLILVGWLVPYLGLSALNYAKIGEFRPFVGGGPALALGTLMQHRISEPDDGPATKQLYEDLREDYAEGRSPIEWSPAVWESDRYGREKMAEAYRLQTLRYGYEEAEARLRAVGMEAVRKRPLTYAIRVGTQTLKFLRLPSRQMQSWFSEGRMDYAQPDKAAERKPGEYDDWVYTRPWAGMDEDSLRLTAERSHFFSTEIWSARPSGNRTLLRLLDEWERVILLPGLWLAVFSILALVWLWRTPHREILLIYGFVILGHAFITSLVFHVSNRYVAVILPWYIAAAAVGVRETLRRYAVSYAARHAPTENGD